MRFRIVALSAVAGPALLLLSGCVFSPGAINSPRIEPNDLETRAETALEDQTGQRPEIDCGEGPIYLEARAEVDCLLIDPVAGLEFDTVITFETVAGSDYTIEISVADVANNAPEPTVEPDAGGETPTVPATDIEGLAIEALTAALGFVPEIHCPGADVPIFIGSVTTCSFEDSAGTHEVEVTVTEFDGERYTINAIVVE